TAARRRPRSRGPSSCRARAARPARARAHPSAYGGSARRRAAPRTEPGRRAGRRTALHRRERRVPRGEESVTPPGRSVTGRNGCRRDIFAPGALLRMRLVSALTLICFAACAHNPARPITLNDEEVQVHEEADVVAGETEAKPVLFTRG